MGSSVISPYLSYDNLKNFILCGLDSMIFEELITRDKDREKQRERTNIYNQNNRNNRNKNNNNVALLIPYEVESIIAKLLEEEIKLIEAISYCLDDFFNYESFSVHSILARLDIGYKRHIDELE